MLGGTSQNNAPSSALYSALKSMMTSKHRTQTSYGATRDMYKYTDCENGDISKISSFYSGTTLNGAWDSGATWNREHTWPNSKGLGGNDENDIMMLRPTAVSENSGRGNKAYGKVNTQYIYYPNSESNGAVDVRGDCARICLYVYTRWGNTSKMWGSYGVIESLDTLIEWMIADPVDTWEMGRNDAVQSITGVRNVYVDYPELAFKLFGYSVPANYSSPSGLGNSIGGSGAVVTPPVNSNPTSSTPNVLDQVTGNNSNPNNNSKPTTSTDASGNKVDTSKDYEFETDECRHDITIHKNEVKATCISEGRTPDIICDGCGLFITEGKEVPKTTHHSADNDKLCDYCNLDLSIKIEVAQDGNTGSFLDGLFAGGILTIVAISVGGALMLGAVIVVIVVVSKKKKSK